MGQTVSETRGAGRAEASPVATGLRSLVKRPARPVGKRPSRARAGAPAWLTPRLLEIFYVALLAILLVRLIHTIVTPLPRPAVEDAGALTEQGPTDLTVFDRYDPFGGTVGGAPLDLDEYANAAETTLDLRLVGATMGGGIGTATIETPDGRQRAYMTGEEIMRGVSLRDVRPPNQAILSRSGVAETLTIEGREGTVNTAPRRSAAPRDLPRGAAPAGPSAATNAAPASPAEAQAIIQNAFRLETAEEGALSLYPGDAPELFRAAGFQPGDVVMAVDGTPAPQDGESLMALMADLPPGRPFTVTIERQGMALDVPIDLSRTPR